jgi:glycosyltransferase involved in cell wall biosynthesis
MIREGTDQDPALSVVMPAYNAAATVDAAITSVCRQTRSDWELVVVDDGSADDTYARAAARAEDARIRVVRQANAGLPAARNRGIREARGRYVSFLDSDDLLAPEYLDRMTGALEADPTAGLAYTDAWVLDDATRRIRRVTAMELAHPPSPPPTDPQAFLLRLLRANFVFVAATVRRSTLDQVGLFREELTALEDYELWLRISAAGWRAASVPGPLALYRRSAGQMSADRHRMLRNEAAVFHIAAAHPGSSPDSRALAEARARAAEEALRRERLWPVRALRDLHRRAGQARLSRSSRHWFAAPPDAVTAAFGDLESL